MYACNTRSSLIQPYSPPCIHVICQDINLATKQVAVHWTTDYGTSSKTKQNKTQTQEGLCDPTEHQPWPTRQPHSKHLWDKERQSICLITSINVYFRWTYAAPIKYDTRTNERFLSKSSFKHLQQNHPNHFLGSGFITPSIEVVHLMLGLCVSHSIE